MHLDFGCQRNHNDPILNRLNRDSKPLNGSWNTNHFLSPTPPGPDVHQRPGKRSSSQLHWGGVWTKRSRWHLLRKPTPTHRRQLCHFLRRQKQKVPQTTSEEHVCATQWPQIIASTSPAPRRRGVFYKDNKAVFIVSREAENKTVSSKMFLLICQRDDCEVVCNTWDRKIYYFNF